MEIILSITQPLIVVALTILSYYQNKRIDVLENKVKNLEVNNIGEE